ncbi:hypothetical protein EVAR_20965_1 [Eumeta japonica]|uniref:Gustatory receptor n=1 Tax=Eumeta variegata TaxID=151549 RepID=A0A4C1V721_EUMVA|nr:hypothetical protein EVAR_20965_1 [Eumeta japonica]
MPLLSILLIHLTINSTREDTLTKIILVTFSFILPHMIQFVLIAYLYTLLLFVKYILRDISGIFLHMKKVTMRNFYQFEEKSFLFHLRNVKMSYMEVFEVTKDLNNTFEVPILITIIGCFHAIVSEAHIIYHGVIVEKMLHFHWIINCSMWIIWQMLKIHVLSRCGETLKLEVCFD